jgi:hypothetical protein
MTAPKLANKNRLYDSRLDQVEPLSALPSISDNKRMLVTPRHAIKKLTPRNICIEALHDNEIVDAFQ